MKQLILLILILASILTMEAQTPQIKWWYDVNDSAFGNSAMDDIDMDGLPEIVFSCYRNDSTVYALNAEDGSLLWKYNTGGCNDVAPVIYDVDMDDTLEVILPSSCVPKTFCFDGPSGTVEWSTWLHGSDSPPTIGDIDNDGKPEILHGNFGGYVSCLNGENGSVAWDIPVDLNSWIQTAPIILDADNDGQLDFVVANWNFDTLHRVFCFRGDNQALIWESDLPNDVMYHGAAFADIDEDGFMELAIGTYDGTLLVLNAEDGSLKWDFSFPTAFYIGAPVSIADLNNDYQYEIVFFDAYKLGVLNRDGNLLWDYYIPSWAHSFRGAAISDVNNDDTLDIVFGTSHGDVYAIHGTSGDELWHIDLAAHHDSAELDIDHGPIIGDFDKDSLLDIFVVGGRTDYPVIEYNYGRAYAITTNMPGGPDWPMFRHDIKRSATVPITDSTISVSESRQKDYYLEVYPNPTNDILTIEYKLEKNSFVDLQIINLLGEEISTICSSAKQPGSYLHKIALHGSANMKITPGVYFIRLRIDNNFIIRKIIVQ